MAEFPGGHLEKAAGEIASDAGKSIVGAMRRRLDAWMAVRSAPDEAKAEEIKKDKAHEGTIRRQQELDKNRREEEKKEVVHYTELQELWLRAIGRTREQIVDEQKRLEWVSTKSISFVESDPDRNKARDIPDDWLKRFLKYAAEVDEIEILEILAKGLAAAAIRSRPILSPKALDTLRFFELQSYNMFTACAQSMANFEYVPVDMLTNSLYVRKIDLDLALMIELGLIKEVRQKFLSYHIGDMFITFSYDTGVNNDFAVIQLTYVGRSISYLQDRRALELGEALLAHKITKSHIEIQQKLGFTPEVAIRLARYLIAMTCDTGNCDIVVRSSTRGNNVPDFSSRRVLPIDEYPIEAMRGPKFDDQYTNELVEAFIGEFKNFNDIQLPYMYTDDERLKYEKLRHAANN